MSKGTSVQSERADVLFIFKPTIMFLLLHGPLYFHGVCLL